MVASLTHLGMEAVTLELEKEMDDRSYHATQYVQPWLPKLRVVNNFKIKVKFFLYLAVVGFLVSAAFAKPTNPCNAETQFWVENEDGSSSCEDCPPCLPGQGLSLECGTRIRFDAMVTCKPCPAGVSFSDNHDASSCTPCSSCADDQVVQQNCTPEWDIECGRRCYSNDRYYDKDKGDCLPCSKCCHDDHDVAETECKEKLGAGSDMICSFHSSVNRCDQSTPSPPTTFANQSTTTSNYTNPSQGFTHEDTEPSTADSHRKVSTTKTASKDLAISLSIPVTALVLLIVGCLYKARKMLGVCCCSFETETGIPETVVHYKLKGNLDIVNKESVKSAKNYSLGVVSTESMQPLLEKGNQEGPICSCQDGVEEKFEESDAYEPVIILTESGEENIEDVACSSQVFSDSTLLSSLLDDEFHLRRICECLDTPMGGLDFGPVAQHYGLDFYKIANLKRNDDGPSRALIELLSATKPDLTVGEFATVVRKKASRNDAAKRLQEFDSEKKKETSEV